MADVDSSADGALSGAADSSDMERSGASTVERLVADFTVAARSTVAAGVASTAAVAADAGNRSLRNSES
jgi:uncharacterized membrane protein (DUF4010 family)